MNTYLISYFTLFLFLNSILLLPCTIVISFFQRYSLGSIEMLLQITYVEENLHVYIDKFCFGLLAFVEKHPLETITVQWFRKLSWNVHFIEIHTLFIIYYNRTYMPQYIYIYIYIYVCIYTSCMHIARYITSITEYFNGLFVSMSGHHNVWFRSRHAIPVTSPYYYIICRQI